MTREETVSLLLHLLTHEEQSDTSVLRIVLTEILRRTSVANVLALQFALEDLQKATQG